MTSMPRPFAFSLSDTVSSRMISARSSATTSGMVRRPNASLRSVWLRAWRREAPRRALPPVAVKYRWTSEIRHLTYESTLTFFFSLVR